MGIEVARIPQQRLILEFNSPAPVLGRLDVPEQHLWDMRYTMTLLDSSELIIPLVVRRRRYRRSHVFEGRKI